MPEDRLETRQTEDIPKTRAHKVADQPETTTIHLNKVLKAADLQGMRAITLLQEPKADLAILLRHQVAAAVVAQPVAVVAAAVHVRLEQEEVNQFKHTR